MERERLTGVELLVRVVLSHKAGLQFESPVSSLGHF